VEECGGGRSVEEEEEECVGGRGVWRESDMK
jgi:hypothetical protein